MSELRDVLERAERAVASLSLSSDGFERLTRRHRRRRRRNRILAGVVGLLVAAGGTLGSLAYLRALHSAPQHPAGQAARHASPTPGAIPIGLILQRPIGGEPAQRLGPFWFGVKEDNSCLTVGPLAIGPSWTFQDGGHDCVGPLGSDSLGIGQARGVVHRDGDPGEPTRFNAVYGLATAAAGRVDVVWAGGGVSSVVPMKGRFLLVWSGRAWPLRATAISADGKELGTVDLTPP